MTQTGPTAQDRSTAIVIQANAVIALADLFEQKADEGWITSMTEARRFVETYAQAVADLAGIERG